MSLCFPENGAVSCGACCGLFNLKLDAAGYKQVLKDRTNLFKETVDFNRSNTLPAYRKNRENLESSIVKNDETTYNCPFLGYVGGEGKRIGCMIHPYITGDLKSQNYSFYGASICQGYDCKNKEHSARDLFEGVFKKVAADSIEYSYLSSDHIFSYAIEQWLVFKGWSLAEGFQKFESIILALSKARLESPERNYPTSFEIRFEDFLLLEDVYNYMKTVLGGGEKESIIERVKNTPVRV